MSQTDDTNPTAAAMAVGRKRQRSPPAQPPRLPFSGNSSISHSINSIPRFDAERS